MVKDSPSGGTTSAQNAERAEGRNLYDLALVGARGDGELGCEAAIDDDHPFVKTGEDKKWENSHAQRGPVIGLIDRDRLCQRYLLWGEDRNVSYAS